MTGVQHDNDCFILDELGFQVGAVAKVVGHYAAEWPDPVRILGIERFRGKLNITIGTLEGDEPTDGFSINEINPEPRHRLAHAPPVVAGQGLGVAASQPGHQPTASAVPASRSGVPNAFEVRQHPKLTWVWQVWDVEHSAKCNHFPVLEVDSKGASDDFHEEMARVCTAALNRWHAQADGSPKGGDASLAPSRSDDSPVGNADAPNLSAVVADEGPIWRAGKCGKHYDAECLSCVAALEYNNEQMDRLRLTRPAIERERIAKLVEECQRVIRRDPKHEIADQAWNNACRYIGLAIDRTTPPSSPEADGGVAK